MRTTLDLPVELIETARGTLGFKSKTDTIVYALNEVVRRSKLNDLRSLFGSVEFDADPMALRGKPAAVSVAGSAKAGAKRTRSRA